MHATPKIAIITRTKNRTILLHRAIESVLKQSLTDWIHVIVNDGGDAPEVDQLVATYADRYAGRLKVIHHPESLGMETASNRGMAASESTYAVIHDDDDSWEPDFLKKTVGWLENPPLPSFKAVATWATLIMEKIEGNSVREQYREPFNHWMDHISLFRMTENNTLPPICFVFRRDVYDELGGFDESLPVLGDWHFHLNYLLKYDIGLICEPLALYHHRPATESDQYGNTVRSGVSKHRFYDNLLRNRWLREDIAEGKIGLGFWTNIGNAKNSFDLRITHTLEMVKKLVSRTGLLGRLKKG